MKSVLRWMVVVWVSLMGVGCGQLQGMIDDIMDLSPTIEGYSYSVQSRELGNVDAELALEAVIIANSKWEGKMGDKCDCQVQLMGDSYGGVPDELEIYYFQKGTVLYHSPESCTIRLDGQFKAINGNWTITREENGDLVTLKSGSKNLVLKFWHKTN